MKNNKNNSQKGGVSLFVVIFACLMVTIVTVSFVSLMIRNQQQATNADLSSSAYDSAMAGVEDAKRLAILYRDCKDSGDTSPECSHAIAAVDAQDCNSIQAGLNGSTSIDEVKIKSSSSDTNSEALNQAYTCVKIDYYTKDVKREIRDGETQMVALRAKGGASFNEVKISWHKRSQGATDALSAPDLADPLPLPVKGSWSAYAYPAILRTQLLQTAQSFTLDDFNQTTGGKSDTNTLFLYPVNVGSTSTSFTGLDPRPNTIPRKPVGVTCDSDRYSGGDYACSVVLSLPVPVGGTDAGDRKNTFLLLSSIYNATDYKIELFKDGTQVEFDGVQPSVDATGRANDLFRRVDARVEFDAGSFNYPSAALDIEGDLCKDFAVTDETSHWSTLKGRCDP